MRWSRKLLMCAVVAGCAAVPISREELRPFDFAPPTALQVVTSPAFDGGPNISPDGLSLYFTSDRDGGAGGGDL